MQTIQRRKSQEKSLEWIDSSFFRLGNCCKRARAARSLWCFDPCDGADALWARTMPRRQLNLNGKWSHVQEKLPEDDTFSRSPMHRNSGTTSAWVPGTYRLTVVLLGTSHRHDSPSSVFNPLRKTNVSGALSKNRESNHCSRSSNSAVKKTALVRQESFAAPIA